MIGHHMEAARSRLEREYNERVTLAWTINNLERRKRLPTLKTLLISGPKTPVRKPASELFKTLLRMTKSMGGEIIVKE